MGEGLKRAFAAAKATRKKGKSMTGDGAVVRADHAKAAKDANRIMAGKPIIARECVNLARAYLAQAAEIADLLKALERYGAHKEPCRELTAETAKMFYKPRCICGLDDAIKAAKGETL